MPFSREALRKKTAKRVELGYKVKKGKITEEEMKAEMKSFAGTLDEYGFCDPDVVQMLDSSDID